MRYYTDENISKALINSLVDKDLDVLSCQEAGMLTTSDVEQLLFVEKEKRIIITRDDDFVKWHKKGAKHAGIIYIHPKMPDDDVVKGILQIHEQHARQFQRKARRLYVIQYQSPHSGWWSKLKAFLGFGG